MQFMPRVCLAFPRFRYTSGDPPLGLLSIAAYMREHIPGLDLLFLDGTFSNEPKSFGNKIGTFQPEYLGIYADSYCLPEALRVAKAGKRAGSYVVLGGPLPSVWPGIIQNPCVDALAIGEAEISFTELVTTSKKSLFPKGFVRKAGKEIIASGEPDRPDINTLPFPARDLVLMDKYIDAWYHLPYLTNLRGTSVIGSRGCNYSCSYCQPNLRCIFGKKTRYVAPARLVKELLYLRKRYCLNAFHLQDDTPTSNRAWLKEFCKGLQESGNRFFWSCNSRADMLDAATLRMLRKAGLIEIRIGIESWSERVRNAVYLKKITNRQIISTIMCAKKIGLRVFGYFMLGAPTETIPEIRSTIGFAARSPLDRATFSIATLLPGTYLHRKYFAYKKTTNIRRAMDYYRVSAGCASGISGSKLECLKKLAYLSFYCHPRRVGQTIHTLRQTRQARHLLKRF